MTKLNLFGLAFDNLTMEESIEKIDNLLQDSTPKYLVTPNVDHLVILENDLLFKEIYNNASLILADGMPIIITSKILNKKIKEKVSGADLVPEVMKLAEEKRYKVFILGAKEGVAQKAKEIILKKCKDPFLIECYSPPFSFENNDKEVEKAIKVVKNFKPDILLVSLGSPKGEKFIYENLAKLDVPLSMSIGAAIDFMAGSQKRAPRWMQKLALEWFFRFLNEPKRMFKRYFINDMKFINIFFREFKKYM